MERNEPCWCGSGKKYKKCHMPIDEKIQLHADRGEIVPSRAILKTPAQIEMIRKSADLNTAVLDEVAKHIRIGMSTAEIDEIVYRFTTEHGGIPAPLNYQGFPKSVCTSLNNEICHGIPDENIIVWLRRKRIAHSSKMRGIEPPVGTNELFRNCLLLHFLNGQCIFCSADRMGKRKRIAGSVCLEMRSRDTA